MYIDSLVVKLTVDREFSAGSHTEAHYVGDLGKSRENALSGGITQSPLNIVLKVEVLVYAASRHKFFLEKINIGAYGPHLV